MRRPFHYAFVVRDLESTRAFYGRVMGAREGRSTDTWIDFDFFGNQISAHVGPRPPRAKKLGQVDRVKVPIPHFGALVSVAEFRRLAARLTKAHARFVIPPTVRYRGRPAEQSTMFFLDPSGNPIEIKAFRNPRTVFRP